MDLYDYLKFAAALIFVLSLMGGLGLALKKFGSSLGNGNGRLLSSTKRRLKIIETLHIDPKRKAIILQRDHKQHLVLLGPSGETVIETNISTSKEKENDKSDTTKDDKE